MSYSISIFSELRKSYPTWEALQTYLTSPEGGQIRSVGEGRYRILRYTKGISDLTASQWMRSVIWDTERHIPVCVAPPKAEKGETGENISFIQDFLDGIMINVFHTPSEPNVLQIATRTQLGAGGKFYSEKTFADMFDEACKTMRVTKDDILKLVPADGFASLLLQHPEHRVVARCRNPHLWIIHSGSVDDNGVVNIDEVCSGWPAGFQLPIEQIQPSGFADLCEQKGWFFQGCTFKDGKGKRWRMRNPNYLYLRALRGSESTSVDRFLRLRAESKVSEYLKHYSEDRQTFWDYEQTLRSKTQEVFQGYCDVHKAHSKKLDELEWCIRPCVFKLHAHYLEHLRPNNEKVYIKHAVELINNLPVFEQKRLLTSTSS